MFFNLIGLSSLSDLLGKQILRIAVWSISSVTFIGNLLVLWERFTAKDDNQVLSIFIRNLAREFHSIHSELQIQDIFF